MLPCKNDLACRWCALQSENRQAPSCFAYYFPVTIIGLYVLLEALV